MDQNKAKKLTLVINSMLLVFVLGLMAFFNFLKADFLTYFSIPTAFVYIFGYYLIHREKLDIYVWIVYFWITLYMCVTTICLGYGFGFHLYCLSMISVLFVTEYISYKIKGSRMRSLTISIAIAVAYLFCTTYAAYSGPVYERDQKYAAVFWVINSLTVLSLIIFYANYMIKLIISSEEKLIAAALTDQLTGLYNRHYMLTKLNSLPDDTSAFIAMADIDNFKKINDTYGHNGGDEVLRSVSKTMTEVCKGCHTSRWGGEEFLILCMDSPESIRPLLETLRTTISSRPVKYEDTEINVTLTIGFAGKVSTQSVDEWIKTADDRLYCGKTSGKNVVIG